MIDLLDPTLFATGRAHPAYARLRRDEPISWRGAYWAILRHADVVAVGDDCRTFSSAHGTGVRAIDGGLRSIHLSDAPIHAEMRAVLEASLGRAWLRALAEPLRADARARVAAWSGTVDAVATLADPIAFGVLARLLGEAPPELLPAIHRFARYDDARYRRDGETPEACFRDAERVVWDMLAAIVEDRRRRPRDDVPSRLIGALEHRDLMFALRFVVQTGYQTSALAIAAAVAIVADDPRRLAELSTDATPRAADEILRWSSPVIRFARQVTRDTALGGVALRAGDRVVMFYASANRDEAVFADPDRVELARAPNPHVAFGSGPHACAGAALARLQLAAVLDALRGRRIELVEPPRWFASSVNAGYDRVVVSAR